MKFDDERVRAVLLGKKLVRRVTPPDLGCEVGVRMLSDTEVDAARVAAVEYVDGWAKRRSIALASIHLLDESLVFDETKRQICWRAFEDVDKPGEKFFGSIDDVRGLSAMTIDGLYRAYVEHQELTCPRGSLSKETVDELVDALGKEGPQTDLGLLTVLEPDTLRVFVRSLASRLRETSQSGSSSTSSEPSTTA